MSSVYFYDGKAEIDRLDSQIMNKIRSIFSLDIQYQIKKQKLIELGEHYLVFYYLGIISETGGEISQALKLYEKCISVKPSFIDSYLKIATISQNQGDLETCKNYLLKAKAKGKKDARVTNYLGVVCHLTGNFRKASDFYLESASEASKTNDKQLQKMVLNNVGFMNSVIGNPEEAMRNFQTGLDIQIPNYTDKKLDIQMLQNKLLTYDYIAIKPKNTFRDYKLINTFFTDVSRFDHTNHVKNEKMRVGYLSPNFNFHAVAFFVENILRYREKFEVYCYSNSVVDEHTPILRNLVGKWFDITKMDDDNAARLIYSHNLDILVDLVGHTFGNRISILARKPAKIQIEYLGFPNTTGLNEIDYFITDSIADPLDTKQKYTEKLLRMPKCFVNYRCPFTENQLPLKVEVHGPIVFGVMNKINKHCGCFESWRKILDKVPSSKLIVMIRKDNIVSYMERLNVTQDRLIVVDFQPDHLKYWKIFYNIDINLDTFSYSGTTTTCNSLFMSIPTITLCRKNRHCHNVSSSILKNANAGELIASSEEEYVNIAVNLANDRQRIQEYKRTMRTKFVESMNPQEFVRDYENLLEGLVK